MYTPCSNLDDLDVTHILRTTSTPIAFLIIQPTRPMNDSAKLDTTISNLLSNDASLAKFPLVLLLLRG
jgi:hypothetical protein